MEAFLKVGFGNTTQNHQIYSHIMVTMMRTKLMTSNTIQDDVVVSGQDVAAGFVRMGILPRICFLLEVSFCPFILI